MCVCVQLLVLNFDHLVVQPQTTMKLITQHYGLPVLQDIRTLPAENSVMTPNRIVSIKCATRDAAAAAYHGHNQDLYKLLKHDRAHRRAPDLEPPFPEFDVLTAVKCNSKKERTLGEADGSEDED